MPHLPQSVGPAPSRVVLAFVFQKREDAREEVSVPKKSEAVDRQLARLVERALVIRERSWVPAKGDPKELHHGRYEKSLERAVNEAWERLEKKYGPLDLPRSCGRIVEILLQTAVLEAHMWAEGVLKGPGPWRR